MDPSRPTHDSDKKPDAVDSEGHEHPVATARPDTGQEHTQSPTIDADATRHERELEVRLSEQLESDITDSQPLQPPVHDTRRVDERIERLEQEIPPHLEADATTDAYRRDHEHPRGSLSPNSGIRLRKSYSQPEIAHSLKRIFNPHYTRGDPTIDVEAQRFDHDQLYNHPLPPHPPADHHGKAPLPHLAQAFERDMRLWHEERETRANQEHERERRYLFAGDQQNIPQAYTNVSRNIVDWNNNQSNMRTKDYGAHPEFPLPTHRPPQPPPHNSMLSYLQNIPIVQPNRQHAEGAATYPPNTHSEMEIIDDIRIRPTHSLPFNVPPAITVPHTSDNHYHIYDRTPLTGVSTHSGLQPNSEDPVIQLIATLMNRGSDNFRSDLGRLLGELRSEHAYGNQHAQTLPSEPQARQGEGERRTVSISIQQPDESLNTAVSAVAFGNGASAASGVIDHDRQNITTAPNSPAGLAGIGSGNTAREQRKVNRLSAPQAQARGRNSSVYSDTAGHSVNQNHHYATSLPGDAYSSHRDERYQRSSLHPDVLTRDPSGFKQGVRHSLSSTAGGGVGGEQEKDDDKHNDSKGSRILEFLRFLRECYTTVADSKRKAREEARASIIANSVHDHLYYTREVALEEEKSYRRKATRLGWYLNLAITSQLLLNAIVTGLSASGSSKHAVSVLGGFGTAVSGYIARARGSNEPYTSLLIVTDLKKFIRDIDGFIQDHGKENSHDYNEHILAYRERLEKVLGNITEFDEKLKSRKFAGVQPAPVAPSSTIKAA